VADFNHVRESLCLPVESVEPNDRSRSVDILLKKTQNGSTQPPDVLSAAGVAQKDFRTSTMMMRLSLLALFVAATSAYDVPSLTPENYDALTEGKTVFLKFFAPWVSDRRRSCTEVKASGTLSAKQNVLRHENPSAPVVSC
jgi:hypothetical protein